MDSPSNYPDGLTQALIDALVTEVDALVRPVHRMPPLFADRDAAVQREHRRVSRAMTRVAHPSPPVIPVVANAQEAA